MTKTLATLLISALIACSGCTPSQATGPTTASDPALVRQLVTRIIYVDGMT
jgi:hypothetical protein